MNKRIVVICSIVAAILIIGIAAAVIVLYGGSSDGQTMEKVKKPRKSKKEQTEFVVNPALKAIPTDAIAVALLEDASSCQAVMPAVIASSDWGHFISSLVDTQVVVSIHFNGNLQTLAVVKEDNTLHNKAVQAGLKCSTVRIDGEDYLIMASTETLGSSSSRHVSLGQSVLDVESFSQAYYSSNPVDAVYFSHQYADKILSAYYGKQVARYSSFVSKAATWTYFNVTEWSPSSIALNGNYSASESPQYYLNVFSGLAAAEYAIGEVAPVSTEFYVDLPLSDIAGYVNAYKKYLDVSGKLASYEKNLSAALEWAQNVGLKEVAVVRWKGWKGEDFEAIFARTKNKGKQKEVAEYGNPSYVSTIFGSIFSIADESCYVNSGEWTISGSEAAVTDWLNGYNGSESFERGNIHFVVYSKPRTLLYDADGISLTLDGGDVVRNTSVQISKGPFEVTNCATGKKNLFSQNESLYLCLKDADGKGLWGVPFDTPICGRASDIDYLKNGKIQFLFAAGTKLYLIDRLGRFVTDFPVELGKEVLLGPDVYDFAGDKNYQVMVLHTDNTLEMYDLKGEKNPSWKGIKPSEPILDLPQLVTVDGEKLWKVTTLTKTLSYPFDGGDPIKEKK